MPVVERDRAHIAGQAEDPRTLMPERYKETRFVALFVSRLVAYTLPDRWPELGHEGFGKHTLGMHLAMFADTAQRFERLASVKGKKWVAEMARLVQSSAGSYSSDQEVEASADAVVRWETETSPSSLQESMFPPVMRPIFHRCDSC